MNGYIYITTNLITGKQYVGQSINKRDIKTYLGSGIAFKCALRKYGKDNFEKTILVDNVSCLNELNKLERDFIRKYDCIIPNGYNLDLGGTNKGRMSEATKAKMIKSKTGKKHTQKQIEANIKSHKGLKLTDETKKKISESMKGKKPSAECVEARKIGYKRYVLNRRHTNNLTNLVGTMKVEKFIINNFEAAIPLC